MNNQILLIAACLVVSGCASHDVFQSRHQSVIETRSPAWFSPSYVVVDKFRCNPTMTITDHATPATDEPWDTCVQPDSVESFQVSEPGIFTSMFGGLTQMLGLTAIGVGLAHSGDTIKQSSNAQGGGVLEGGKVSISTFNNKSR